MSGTNSSGGACPPASGHKANHLIVHDTSMKTPDTHAMVEGHRRAMGDRAHGLIVHHGGEEHGGKRR